MIINARIQRVLFLLSLFFLPTWFAAEAQTGSAVLYYVVPGTIAANSPGATVQIVGSFPRIPPGFCFYTGYGSTAILPGTASSYYGSTAYTITVPASTIQQIPPASFTNGTFSASVYQTDSASTPCNGTSYNARYTNTVQAQISTPTLSSVDLQALPQHNPNFTAVSAPTVLYAYGSNFATGTVATFTGSGGVSFTSPVTFTSASSLRIDSPIVPSGQTSLSLTLCSTATYTFCTAATSFSVNPLQANPGTLTATANSNGTYDLLAAFGAVAGNTAGIPLGAVAFSDNGGSIGSAAGQVTAQSLVAASRSGTWYGYGGTLTPAVADFDRDGLPDLLVADSSTSYELHLLRGSNNRGDLADDVAISLGNSIDCSALNGFAIGDFNGDGYPDIAVLCAGYSGNSNIFLLLNQKDGTFSSTQISLLTPATMIAAGDMNKDGKVDLVLAGPLSAATNPQYGFTILTGDGTGAFPTSTNYVNAAAQGQGMIVADLNNDGYPDVILQSTGVYRGISVLQNTAGTLPTTPTYNDGTLGVASHLSVQQVAGKFPNIILTSSTNPGFAFAILANGNTAAISFAGYFLYAGTTTTTSLAVGDFNNDGVDDVATSDGSTIKVYLANANGFFTDGSPAPPSYTLPATHATLAGTGDFNSDGYRDLLAVFPSVGEVRPSGQGFITSGTVAARLPGIAFASGTHALTATTPGTVAYAAGTASQTLTIARPTATATLSVTPQGSATYSPTTLETISVVVSSLVSPLPTGTVTIANGSTTLGTATLVMQSSTSSIATLQVKLPAGPASLSALYNGDTVYAAASATAQQYTVQKGTPVVSFAPALASIVYGTALSAQQLNATAQLNGATISGVFTYTPALGTVLNAGANQRLQVSFAPTDNIDYNSPITSSAVVTVTQATPAINWPTPAGIIFGTALSGTQLNASATNPVNNASVDGTYNYTPAAGTVPGAGSQQLSVVFTPANTSNYTSASAGNSIQVAKANPSVAWATPAAITAGTPLSSTQLNATATGVTNATLPGTFTYTPPAGTILAAGSTTLRTDFVPTDTVDYNNGSATVTQVVNSASTSLVLSSSLNPSTYGPAVSITAMLGSSYAGANPGGSVTFTEGGLSLGTSPIVAGAASISVVFTAGTHTLSAAYSGDSSFAAARASGFQQVVNQAVPSISWAAPSAIVYGSPLSSVQLNASAVDASGNIIPGRFVYTPAAGAVLNAGLQRLGVSFTPNDAVNYASAAGQTSLSVLQAVPTVVWSTPAPITAGTALTSTQLNATATGIGGASLTGTFVYTPPAGTVLPNGTTTLNTVFTPGDQVNYKSASSAVQQVVNSAVTTTLLTSLTNPSTFGQSVTFTANVNSTYTGAALSGTVSFTDGQTSLGTVALAGGSAGLTTSALGAGTHLITANYSGNQNFAQSSGQVTQAVSLSGVTLTWAPPAPIVYGTALSAQQLNASVSNAAGASVAGTLVYSPAAGAVLTAGVQTLSVAFTPADTANYKPMSSVVNLTVTQALPSIVWPTPAAVIAGTALSSTQLNASATGINGGTLPGSFVYTPPAGSIVNSGPVILNLVFTPTDTINYSSATASVSLPVTPVSLTSLSSTTALLGDKDTTITLTGTGFATDSVATLDGNSATTQYVNGTTLRVLVPAVQFTTVHTIAIAVRNPTQGKTTGSLSLVVSPAPLAGGFSGPSTTTVGGQPNVTFALSNPYPVPLTAVFTLTFTPMAGLTVDPTVLFANGTSTYTVVIPAGSTSSTPLLIQSGSVAGMITLTSAFTAGGVAVTPAGGAQSLIITSPAAVPGITSILLERKGNVLTVTLRGYANTRAIDHVNFHFVSAAGAKLGTNDLTIPGATLFAPYYASAASQAYGSTFTYTQDFNIDGSAGDVEQIQVTLVNAIGSSTQATVQ